MPNAWLNVPHYKQEFHYSCVAACARMMLAHFGQQRSEEELRQLLGTKESGTRVGNLTSLETLGFDVSLREANLSQLRDAIAISTPVMVFVETGTLDYWNLDVAHVVVVVGVETSTIHVDDPFFDHAPQSIPISQFESAGAKTGQFAAFIQRRS